MRNDHHKSVSANNYPNSTVAQRQRLIEALRAEGSLGMTTIQIRELLDIMAPAARIYELRWLFGYNIQQIRDCDRNAQGKHHVCSRYVLTSGHWHGEDK